MGLDGEAMSPLCLRYFRTQGPSGGILRAKFGKIKGGNHRFKSRKADFHPRVSHLQKRRSGEETWEKPVFSRFQRKEGRKRARHDLWKLGLHWEVALGG